MKKNLFCRQGIAGNGNNSTLMNKRFQYLSEEIKLFTNENNSSLLKPC